MIMKVSDNQSVSCLMFALTHWVLKVDIHIEIIPYWYYVTYGYEYEYLFHYQAVNGWIGSYGWVELEG